MPSKCDDRKVCTAAFFISLVVFGAALFAMVYANGHEEGLMEIEGPVANGRATPPVLIDIPANLAEQRMVQESIIEKQGDIQHDIDAIRAFLQDDIAAQSGEIPREEVLTIDEYVSQETPVSNAQRLRSAEISTQR
jgi:hypothetical protein